MSKLTKKEFIDAIARSLGDDEVSKVTIEKVLGGLSKAITAELNDDNQIVIPDVGILDKRARPARKGRNPATGAEIEIAATNACGFKSVKAMKDALNS